MKKLYILLSGLVFLNTSSCIKKTSTEIKPDLPKPAVEGYLTSYTTFTHRDTLKINPVVDNENQYDYFWTAFSGNFNVTSGVVPKGDTLSKTKDLSYPVTLNPGQYTLVFNVKNKRTAVTQLITSKLVVSTLTGNGWYLLKDDDNKTDFDFIYGTGRIDNLISFFNGKSLTGKAIKSVYCGSFKQGLKSTDLFNVLFVISDQDAAICRIDNGKIVMGFDDMFFTKPANKKPQNVLQQRADNSIHFINDGIVYAMVKGSFFSSPPVSSYQISPVAAVGAIDIAFDENSKSVVFLDGANYVTLASNGAQLKNMNASMVWAGGYPGLRGAALALFRQAGGDGLLVKMNIAYGPMIGSGNLITGSNPVPQEHGLMSADVIGGNYDSDYIYYAKANKIYMTDFASLPESLQITLPDNELVTCIQHIKYPEPASANVPTTTNYLAIASYNNGNYKVWLCPISSTGTIQTPAQPNFTGKGRVASVNYIENGIGNRTY
jgi:hypothetical protein